MGINLEIRRGPLFGNKRTKEIELSNLDTSGVRWTF